MTRLKAGGVQPLTAVVLTWGFAFLPANLIPTIIARLVNDYGMEVTLAGALATAMTLLNSATVLLIRPRVQRHSRSGVAATGVMILVAVAVLGIFIPNPMIFALLLLIAGVGTGLVLGAASASISGMHDPDRSANIAMIFNRLIVAIAYFTVPLIGGSMTAVLLVLAIPGVLVLLTVSWLPKQPVASETVSEAGENTPSKPEPVGALAWVLAISFGAWSITDDGIVGVAELIAMGRFGDDGSTLFLNMYAVATVAGLGGAVLAPIMTKATSRATAISCTLIISFWSKMLMLLATGQFLYSVAVIGWGFAFGLSLPLIFGMAAVLKKDGSASVTVNGVYILGVALGPIVGTQLYDLGNEPLLAWVMGFIGVASVVAIILVSVQIGRRPGLAEAEADDTEVSPAATV